MCPFFLFRKDGPFCIFMLGQSGSWINILFYGRLCCVLRLHGCARKKICRPLYYEKGVKAFAVLIYSDLRFFVIKYYLVGFVYLSDTSYRSNY